MKLLPTSLAAAVILTAHASADRVSLTNENLVTGMVTALDAQGRLIVDSPNSATPLMLRNDAVQSIDFDRASTKAPTLGERLHLINGDILPGRLNGMNRDHLEFHTWFAGDLHVPRSAVRSIAFGISQQNLVFAGPSGPAGWLDNDGWKFRGSALHSTGRGTIGRGKVLPEQFILRFQLSWENNPSFRLYFCDDLLKDKGQTDRYYFDINTGGTQLKRQSTEDDQKWTTLHSSRRRPEEFRDKSVEIEIRVDRKHRQVYVYIDSELAGRFKDEIGEMPSGSGIMLQSNAGGDVKNIVSGIEIYEWDAMFQLHRNEGHDNPAEDAIITTDSERHGGQVQGMAREDGERLLLLKNPHADDLFRVPLRRTSILYFRQVEAPSPPPESFLINLANQGRLQLTGLRLDQETLTGQSALLGDLTLKRESLVRLEADTPPADQ